MKKLLLITLLTAVSTFTFADEDNEVSEQASAAYIQSVIAMCKQDATEDEVASEELKAYLLECVNDDLVSNGYNEIKSLPSAK